MIRRCDRKCKEPCWWGEVEVSVSTAQYPSVALVPALNEMFPDKIDPNRTVQQALADPDGGKRGNVGGKGALEETVLKWNP